MRLRNADLNLLVAFDALMRECHVTRAANLFRQPTVPWMPLLAGSLLPAPLPRDRPLAENTRTGAQFPANL